MKPNNRDAVGMIEILLAMQRCSVAAEHDRFTAFFATAQPL